MGALKVVNEQFQWYYFFGVSDLQKAGNSVHNLFSKCNVSDEIDSVDSCGNTDITSLFSFGRFVAETNLLGRCRLPSSVQVLLRICLQDPRRHETRAWETEMQN